MKSDDGPNSHKATIDDRMDPVNRPPDVGTADKKISEKRRKRRDQLLCDALLIRAKNKFAPDLLWWQRSLSFKIDDHAVRDGLVKLMGTDTVRLLDKGFMAKLNQKLRDKNCEMTMRRIWDRIKWEMDREKKLIFEGLLSLADGPPGFDQHPYFQSMKQVEEAVAKKRAQIEANKYGRQIHATFDYSIFDAGAKLRGEGDGGISDVSLISDTLQGINQVEPEKEQCQQMVQLEVEEGIIDPSAYESHLYVAPEVKNLRQTSTVDDMYKIADNIFYKV